MKELLSVREMTAEDASFVVDYFVQSDAKTLSGMGADVDKIPDRQEWIENVQTELLKPEELRKFYYTIWERKGKPIGHSNINNIIRGVEAKMHLHIWDEENRKNGIGTVLISSSIAMYFRKFKLQRLICEPYAENKAPLKTLQNVGFLFERKYNTIPGPISFAQEVRRYVLTKERWKSQRLKTK